MKILFIINLRSGTDKNKPTIARIEELALVKEVHIKFIYTNGQGDDALIKKELYSFNPDRVVAGGGDGTVQLVARNLAGTNFPLVLLPLGSANGLATSLEIPQGDKESVDYIFETLYEKSMDLLLINDKHICVHLADIGINALMVKEYEEAGDSGMIGYAKHLIHAIKETPLLNYTIKTEKEELQMKGYMLTFSNANMYGTGIKISEGLIDDGLFEISNIEKVDWGNAVKAGLTLLNIFVDKEMYSNVISCKHAEIFIDKKIDFQIDGEYMGEVNHLKIDILPSAIKILLP
jgi:diacylglycerol kinase (ATP)